MMDKFTENKKYTTLKHILFACDTIMLSTCCINIFYAIFIDKVDYVLLWLTLNTIAVIVFRNWLIFVLQFPWLQNPLNRLFKRILDIALSLLFVIIIFPLIYITKAFYVKMHHEGAVLHLYTPENDYDKYKILTFKNNFFLDILNLSPVALQILIGQYSFWDLKGIYYRNRNNIKRVGNEVSDIIPVDSTNCEKDENYSYLEKETDTPKNIYTDNRYLK